MSKIKTELKDDPLMPLRHSAEHVLHTVMQKMYPDLKKVMGPPIEDGFYFDFDLDYKITPEDLPKIEAAMQEMIDANLPMVRKEIGSDVARKLFSDNKYKLDTLNEIEARGEKISTYTTGDPQSPYYDMDVCAGPHVESTGKIKAFKLLSIAGAYYKGDEKNKMLQRIYGTAFGSKEALDEYLTNLEEAKKRDHRKLGKELDLFTFSDMVGKGLPLFTEYGATIWRELERFVVDEEIAHGYKHVRTPPLAKTDLYKKSGHYPYYADTMYPPMKVDEEELILRPMACPHHFMLYESRPRSYKELPLKLAELADYYRYEKSGELTGLTRVRTFCLADAHIFCATDQAKQVITDVLDLINHVNGILGFVKGKDYTYRLSLGDRANTKKYYDSPKEWEQAENLLREVLEDIKAPYYEAKDEAAFYGPKIDIQMINTLKKEETAFTVQYDFVLPKRFDLKYINKAGASEQPVVIHRSSIGALERVIGFLIEHYAGAFPVWLAPVQAVVIPISEKNNEYARKVAQLLRRGIQQFEESGAIAGPRDENAVSSSYKSLRVEVDERDETMQAKIRDAQLKKVPYMLVVGGKEETEASVNVRLRDGKTVGMVKTEEFAQRAGQKYLTKALDLW